MAASVPDDHPENGATCAMTGPHVMTVLVAVNHPKSGATCAMNGPRVMAGLGPATHDLRCLTKPRHAP
jgi:hypothetical protein